MKIVFGSHIGTWLSRAVAALLAVAWPPLALALDPAMDVFQHGHRAWRSSDGFGLGAVTAIAQTADGYVWLATPTGLLRFDGVRGVPMHPPPSLDLRPDGVQALLGARDGTLWIGTVTGLVRFKGGTWSAVSSMVNKRINAINEADDGSIWVGGLLDGRALFVGSDAGKGILCAIRGESSECHGDDGRFGREVVALYRDSANDLWVAGVDRVWKWGTQPMSTYPLPGRMVGLRTLTGAADGGLFVGLRGQVVRLAEGKVEVIPLPDWARELTFIRVLRDRDGALWLAASDYGLVHLLEGRAVAYRPAHGLSDDRVLDLFEDREGNIWVSTSRGLDQFRPVAAASHGSVNGLRGRPFSILSASDGSMWAGTTAGIYQLDGSRNWTLRRLGGGPLHEDRRRRMWIESDAGLGYFERDRYVPAEGIPQGPVDAITEDAKGNLWIAHRQAGLLCLLPDGRVELTPWTELGISTRVSTMAVDPSDGSLWLGSFFGAVENVAGGRVRTRHRLEDTPIGWRRITQVLAEADGTLWVADPHGLNRIRQGRVSRLDVRNGLPCDTVIGVRFLFDDRFVWIALRCGLARIDRVKMDAWAAMADRGVSSNLEVRLLDYWDGVAPTARGSTLGYQFTTFLTVPRLSRSSDGRIWAVTGDAVVSIDPKRMPVNDRPPPVHVEQLVSDGKKYEARSGVRLPPLPNDVAIEYTGLGFTAPEQVQFRYKLEGRDSNWRDAGARREAKYTDLAPGNYRFVVSAANESGIWNPEGASMEFSIEPAWWQSLTFRAACVGAVTLMLYGLYRLRVSQLSRRFNMSLDARVDERLRIARDLHDTLLQSFQGLILRLQTALQLLPSREGHRILEESIEQAADAVTEGRNAVQGLRGPPETSDLAGAIRTVGHALTTDPAGSPVTFSVEVHGHTRPLHPLLHDDIVHITAEALRNAFRHASASRIEVEIRYDARELHVRVRDDGRGMDPSVAQHGRDGHFGLRGMRERSKLIGGSLTFWSAHDAGTEVELRVPAAGYAGDSLRTTGEATGQKTVGSA